MIINTLILVLFNLYNHPSYNNTWITTAVIKHGTVFSQMKMYNLINKVCAGLPLAPCDFMNIKLKKNTFLKDRCFSSGQPSTPFYANADTQKLGVLKDNKGKVGVYLWINNITGKKYVGSSVQLGIRLSQYFNINYLNRNISMRICQALLKYGYSNFSLQILEYCDKSECIKKETHYIEKLKPEYNIQLFPSTPMLGVKHRKESIAKLKKSLTGLSKSDLHKLNLSLADPGSIEIEAIDLVENKTTVHHSMRAAAKELGIQPVIITKFISRGQVKPYKGRYIFKVKE